MSSSSVKNKECSDRPTYKLGARAKLAANHAGKRLRVVGQVPPEQNRFEEILREKCLTLHKGQIDTLQINLGKMCNLTCHHCHVEAGPNRTEKMSAELIDSLVQLAERFKVTTVDLTGGAPEMCPGFKKYVQAFRAINCDVIVRSNLTILNESGFEDYVSFFASEGVRVIASLPCYTEDNVDAQRGDGVFSSSILALKRLNEAGYGQDETGLILDLVYNPGGPSLPGSQGALEQAYKQQLRTSFGIEFNHLFTITNLPIGRFYSDLKKQGKADAYDALLSKNFNAATVPQLMCVNTLNISWDGWVYDCDFNQMLELPMSANGRPLHVSDLLTLDRTEGLAIATGNHCFGCTAGAGSSCGGELVG